MQLKTAKPEWDRKGGPDEFEPHRVFYFLVLPQGIVEPSVRCVALRAACTASVVALFLEGVERVCPSFFYANLPGCCSIIPAATLASPQYSRKSLPYSPAPVTTTEKLRPSLIRIGFPSILDSGYSSLVCSLAWPILISFQLVVDLPFGFVYCFFFYSYSYLYPRLPPSILPFPSFLPFLTFSLFPALSTAVGPLVLWEGLFRACSATLW